MHQIRLPIIIKKMKYTLTFLFFLIGLCSCQSNKNNESKKIICNDSGCSGKYMGAEFVHSEDIAHQFSNQMSMAVGDELKELYQKGKYKKVDFNSIKMSTKGMGSGNVTYTLDIPFETVNSKCEAYTSFDHVGGWGHAPELEKRKEALKDVTLNGHVLDISDLKTTPEGLQEYWIQWKNKDVQSECE